MRIAETCSLAFERIEPARQSGDFGCGVNLSGIVRDWASFREEEGGSLDEIRGAIQRYGKGAVAISEDSRPRDRRAKSCESGLQDGTLAIP